MNYIEAVGFGAEQPVASNDTAEGRQRNRRANVVLSGPAIGGAKLPPNREPETAGGVAGAAAGKTPSGAQAEPTTPGTVAAPPQRPQKLGAPGKLGVGLNFVKQRRQQGPLPESSGPFLGSGLFFADLLAGALARQGLFYPRLLARLQVVGVPLDFADNVLLLNLTLEPTQGVLERLAFLQSHFCQSIAPQLARIGLLLA